MALRAALIGVKHDSDPGVQHCGGGFQILQFPQLPNQPCTVSAWTVSSQPSTNVSHGGRVVIRLDERRRDL